MRAALVVSALVALIGCHAAPSAGAATAERVIASCERYREAVPRAYGLCLKQAALSLGAPEEMATVCHEAGQWERRCHRGWVTEQAKDQKLTPQQLLDACGPSADCALERLDDAPDPDVLAQIARCEHYAKEYTADCAGHALQRWARGRPAATEIDRVVSRAGAYEVQVGTFLGMIVACQHTVDCPEAAGRVANACRSSVGTYQAHPEKCSGYHPPP